MKHTLPLIIKVQLLSLFVLFAGCKKNNEPREVITEFEISGELSHSDISFANERVGYISGVSANELVSGIIAKTLDGGMTWKILHVYVDTTPSTVIRSIYALSPDTVYATYSCNNLNSGVCKSVDGGSTWKNLGNLGIPAVAYGNVYFKNSQIGFVCRGNTILKTVDGGKNWVTKFHQSGFGGISQLSFTSAEIGYACEGFVNDYGSSGMLLKTTDGGNTWNVLPSFTEYITCLKFVNDKTGYAFTFENNIYKTMDGGQNWTLLKILDGGLYFSAIVAGNIKYFATVNKIYKSTNDFKSFVEIYSSQINNTNFSVKAIQLSNSTIFILSNNSVVKIIQD